MPKLRPLAVLVLFAAPWISAITSGADIPAHGAIFPGNPKLAVRSNGVLLSWGSANYGALADGTTAYSDTPVPVTTIDSVAMVANHGLSSRLLLKSDGTVWAWGLNNYGQIGDGSRTNRLSPVKVIGLSDVISVANASYCSIALRSDGTVWTWGSNQWGALGTGISSSTIYAVSPTMVTSLNGVVAIAANGHSAMALKSDGTLWAWGDNACGQLGCGSVGGAFNSTPTQVVNFAGSNNVVSIAMGEASSYALLSDGTVWAWGLNSYGQLCDGTGVPRGAPVQVNGISNAVAISAGESHAMALLSNGAIALWGDNSDGQIEGSKSHSYLMPVVRDDVPDAIAVSAGQGQSFVLQANGVIRAWGNNTYKSLGTGYDDGVSYPCQIYNFQNAADISSGDFSALALKSDGTVWQWGQNFAAFVGDESVAYSGIPVEVDNLSNVVQISLKSHCAIALENNGTVWTWGNNEYGQLGDGTVSSGNGSIFRLIPEAVDGLSDATMVAAGGTFMMALKSDGTVWTWGDNARGQLGDGSTLDHYIPQQVPNLQNIVKISAGSVFGLALASDGTVYAWGGGYAGQLGNGGIADSYAPVPIAGLPNIIDISAGGAHCLALDSSNSVWAWGGNSNGQLGVGTRDDSSVPLLITNLNDVAKISCGDYQSYAITDKNALYGWGWNYFGVLGRDAATNQLVPIALIDWGSIKTITSSGNRSFAVNVDESIWASGSNAGHTLGIDKNTPSYIPTRLIPDVSDSDFDALLDSWEMLQFGSLIQGPNDDPDKDGLVNVLEVQRGTDPLARNTDRDFFTDLADPFPADYYNGRAPVISIVSGDNQTAPYGFFNPAAFDIAVWDGDGIAPLVNAPVQFQIIDGGGSLAIDTSGEGLTNQLFLETDIDGTVQSYHKQPLVSGAVSHILCSAGSSEVVLTSMSTDIPPGYDSDNDNLDDVWELQYFGTLGRDGTGDYDGDGLSDLFEFQGGGNPSIGANMQNFERANYTYDMVGRIKSVSAIQPMLFTFDAEGNLEAAQ